MRVVQVVPTITNEASGPSYSVVALCNTLNALGVDPSLVVLDSDPGAELPDFVTTFPWVGIPRKIGRSPKMCRWLRRAAVAGSVDIMHSHSLWMMPNVYPGWATRGTVTPLMVSPRGTLSNWALGHSKRVKQVFWSVLQEQAIRHGACFHATAESEYEDIRRAGFRQPVCIIPNGIDVPESTLPVAPKMEQRRLLFLGRIHPVKGVDTLLRAWSAIADRHPEWRLDIVGPDDGGYLDKMKIFARQLKLQRVFFRGPLYGADKLKAYQEADIYILPTHSENFGMTVAEALATGTPAIVTQGAPWAGLEQRGAGWWIEIGIDPLVVCLEEALSCSSEQLAAMGAAGRQWMQEEYSWERVGKMMFETYQWLLGGGVAPEWVKY